MAPTVSDIIHVMDNLAPPTLAEDWDNVGLQVGDPCRMVQKIGVALDPTFEVVDRACRRSIDLLITHHPLIFKPLKSIAVNTPTGSVIHLATRNHLAIFAAHTNLDSAIGGINDILANRIGLSNLEPLAQGKPSRRFKIVIYVPPASEKNIAELLFQTRSHNRQAGRFEDDCRAELKAIRVATGEILENRTSGSFLRQKRVRIEAEVGNQELSAVIEALAQYQAEDKVCYDVYSLISQKTHSGMGRVGKLEDVMDLKSFALMIKKKLGLEFLKLTGDPGLPVHKAAVCSGSGSSLLSNFFKSGAQAYISGDLGYHDARDVQAANLGLIDIGHFPSEHLIVNVLADRLKEIFIASQIDATVDVCDLERDPFMAL
jgi:dinuclear metal center YbgI/SA1388 family protein